MLALVRARRGDPDYRALIDEAHATATGVGELQYLAQSALVRAEVLWLEGRLADIDAVTEGPFELALQLGEPSFSGELGCWRWRAGLLSRPPERAAERVAFQIVGDWAGAAAFWADRGCPYEAALARADSGEPDAMRAALEALDRLGARPAAEIVARRLRELGERACAADRGGRPAPTPRD